MARITVEDCLKNVDNRFALIHLAAKRVRQLRKGAEPLVNAKNKDIVVALREIAAGKVFQVKREDEAPLTGGGLPPGLVAPTELTEQPASIEDQEGKESGAEGSGSDA